MQSSTGISVLVSYSIKSCVDAKRGWPDKSVHIKGCIQILGLNGIPLDLLPKKVTKSHSRTITPEVRHFWWCRRNMLGCFFFPFSGTGGLVEVESEVVLSSTRRAPKQAHLTTYHLDTANQADLVAGMFLKTHMYVLVAFR